MRQIIIIGAILLPLAFGGCEMDSREFSDLTVTKSPLGDGWLIPVQEVFDGGPGKDGIPALTEPKFIVPASFDYLVDEDLVLGFVVGDEVRAYPHAILDWHEIINDKVEDVNIAVTYCPLTGTGIGWNREINGTVTTFGVSGLLYNSNLIPYDREIDSNWSQMRMDCVEGELQGTKIETIALVETTWKTWQAMYPSTTIVSPKTGYDRDYGRYPYGGYKILDDYLLFPVANEDDRLPNKERVHAVVLSSNARIYPLSAFGEQVTVIQEKLRGNDIVVVGNGADNFVTSYFSDPGDGTLLTFAPVQDQYPVVMMDHEECNNWDVFGRAVSGPRKGTQLRHARSFMGYWFSFAAFYPSLTIYGEE